MSPVGAIFVPSPLETGTKLRHSGPPQSLKDDSVVLDYCLNKYCFVLYCRDLVLNWWFVFDVPGNHFVLHPFHSKRKSKVLTR